MDSDSWPLLFAFLFFLIFGGYFAAAESAYSAMNTLRIRSMAADGDRRAKRALKITDDFDRALTTLLIGNNITHIAASSLATLLFLRLWPGKSTVISTLITTAAVFLFSEMIPKSLANDRAETLSLACSGSLSFFMKLFLPAARFFMWISSAVTGLFRRDDAPTVTEEELHDIVDTIEEEGVLNEDESDLFRSALDFSGTQVRDIMTVRNDITALRVDATAQEVIAFIKSTNHSRVPVYEGDLDHIIGTLIVRTYLKSYLTQGKTDLRSLLLEPFFIRPESSVDDILDHMREHRLYLAVVRDDEGTTQGLITIEDLLEELVGEIWDEDDVVDPTLIKLGGNRFRVSPRLKVSEAFSRIGYHPRSTGTFMNRPVVSWVIETLKHIPEEDESFTFEDVEVTVEEVRDRTLQSVVIHVLDRERGNA